MSNFSFTNKKDLIFEITVGDDGTLGPKKIFEEGTNIIKVRGLRATTTIRCFGTINGTNYNRLSAKIWGMSADDMNAASSLRVDLLRIVKNSITVHAVDGDVKTLVFAGDIITSQANYTSMPSVSFDIEAQGAFWMGLKPQSGKSLKGEVDAATIFSQLANDMGLGFEKNGVSVKLRDPAITGSYPEQLQALSEMSGVNHVIDRGVLAIWPKDGKRENYSLKIDRKNGMIGYPTYMDAGISTTILYNPDIVIGGEIELVSDLFRTSGRYYILRVVHNLDANLPNGQWFSTVTATYTRLAGNT